MKKGSSYSITEPRVPVMIVVLGSQPAGDVSHKPGGRLPLLSARPAGDVSHKPGGRLPLLSARPAATLKKAATNFAAWRTAAR